MVSKGRKKSCPKNYHPSSKNKRSCVRTLYKSPLRVRRPSKASKKASKKASMRAAKRDAAPIRELPKDSVLVTGVLGPIAEATAVEAAVAESVRSSPAVAESIPSASVYSTGSRASPAPSGLSPENTVIGPVLPGPVSPVKSKTPTRSPVIELAGPTDVIVRSSSRVSTPSPEAGVAPIARTSAEKKARVAALAAVAEPRRSARLARTPRKPVAPVPKRAAEDIFSGVRPVDEIPERTNPLFVKRPARAAPTSPVTEEKYACPGQARPAQAKSLSPANLALFKQAAAEVFADPQMALRLAKYCSLNNIKGPKALALLGLGITEKEAQSLWMKYKALAAVS